MIKFLTKFLLIFSIFVSNLQADESLDTIDIFLVVKQIDKINKQIAIIKEQNSDQNLTINIKDIENKKNELLDKIPLSMANTHIEKEDVEKYINQKNLLENKLKLIKNTQSDLYFQTSIDYQMASLKEFFYKTLFKIDELFKSGAKDSDIKSVLQNSIIVVQTQNYSEIKRIRDDLADLKKDKFNSSLNELEIYKQSFEEIFEYLLANSKLLKNNFILSTLNLRFFIDYINGISPTNKINFGKIVIIFAILVFFLSLRRILSRFISFLLLFIVNKFSKEKNSNDDAKNHMFKAIKKPILWILMAYAIELCLGVFYYPNIVPLKFANYFSIVYILLTTWFVIAIFDCYGVILLGKIAQKSGRKEVINLIIKIIYFIIVIIAILLILSKMGFDISTIIASLGIGGLAVALATKDIIANFFASIMLLFDNSFSQGDWIVCGDVEGTVVEIGLRKTTVRTFDNALVFVPNSTIMASNVKNWNRRKVGRRIKMEITIDYSSTPAQIRKCLDEIKTMLKNHPLIAKPEDSATNSRDFRMKNKQNMVSVDDLAGYKSNLFVVLDEFADSSINILVYCFSKSVIWGEFLDTKQDVMLKIMDILEKNGVNFAFPSQSVYIEKIPKFERNSDEI